MERELNGFKQLLDKPQKCVIVTHTKPDADALGSSLGLSLYLTQKGHDVTVITPTDYPDFLFWMKGNEEVVVFNGGNEKKSQKIIDECEVIFCLDFSSLSRIDKLGDQVRGSDSIKVLIDHHIDPEDFADFTFSDTTAAATAELIYEIIVSAEDKELIDTDLAECLYAGIMTDTGSFKFSNATQNTMEIAAALVGIGADNAKVAKLIYDSSTLSRLKFLGFALSERLIVNKACRTAYFVISKEDQQKYACKSGDMEGLVNYALSIRGIVMAVLISESLEDPITKMSFRSVGDFSVRELAHEHFNGGGHKNASGGRTDVPLGETIAKFEEVLTQYKSKINSTVESKDAIV